MNWLGVYIFGQTQEGVIAAVCQAVTTLTDGRLVPLAVDPKRPLYPFAPEQLLYVSPEQQNYVACWGLTEPCMHHVMAQSRFSGLIVHTLEDEDSEGADLWFYQVWDAGQIAEWFVSDPGAYFSHWSSENIRSVVLPYARRAGFTLSDSSVASLVASRLFSGGNKIFGFTREATNQKAISDWLSMSATEAPDFAPEILAIPFAGKVYSPESLAIYTDIINGHIRPEQESAVAMDYYWKQYMQVREIGDVARTLRSMAFSWSIEPLEADLKYGEFFTWAV